MLISFFLLQMISEFILFKLGYEQCKSDSEVKFEVCIEVTFDTSILFYWFGLIIYLDDSRGVFLEKTVCSAADYKIKTDWDQSSL